MPLTNRLDCAVLYRLASSSDSLIATLAGTSGQKSNSYAPSRRMLRSMAAIRSIRQFSAASEMSPSIRGWFACTPATSPSANATELAVAAEPALDEPADFFGRGAGVQLGLVQDLERRFRGLGYVGS